MAARRDDARRLPAAPERHPLRALTTPSPLQTSLRALDATLLAGLAVSLADTLPALAAGRIGPGATVVAAGIVLALATLAGTVVAGLALVAPAVDRAVPGRWLLPAGAALVSIVPLVGAALRFVGHPGAALAILVACAALLGWLAHRLCRRATSPVVWLASAVVFEQLLVRAAESVNLVERIDASRPGLPLALLCAGSAAIVVAAELARDLVPSPEPRSRWRAAAAGTAGIAALAAGLLVLPDLYRAAHRQIFVAAFLLLGAGLARLRLPGGAAARAVPVAAALGCVVWLAFVLRLPSQIPWQLTAGTHVVREIVGETGLAVRPFRRFAAGLRARPLAEPRPAAAAPDRTIRARNLVLITVDSLRWDHVGFSGLAPPDLTPSIDALAAGSVRFRSAHTHGAWTSLAVPSLLWSRYPKDIQFTPVYQDSQLRLWFPGEIPAGVVLKEMFQTPRDEPARNLAEVLGAAGFQTVAVPNDGPTRFLEPRIGIVRGFGAVHHPRTVLGAATATGLAPSDEFVATLAIDTLRRLGPEPFFLWVHFYDPHGPHAAPEGATRPYYDGEVEVTDRQVGRVVAALDALGRGADTLLVFTSDHGELISRANPAIGIHGIDVRETLIHVPLLMRAPGAAPRDVAEVVGLIDIAPTMLAAAGVAAPTTMVGRSLGPILAGGALPPRPAFVETWYYEVGTGERMLHQIAAVDGSAKVIFDLRSSSVAFFDLASDPTEKVNLFGDPLEERFLDVAAALARWYGL